MATPVKQVGKPKVDKSTQGADMKARINAVNKAGQSYRTGKPIPTGKGPNPSARAMQKANPNASFKRPTPMPTGSGKKTIDKGPKLDTRMGAKPGSGVETFVPIPTPRTNPMNRENSNKRPTTALPRTPRTLMPVIDDSGNKLPPRTNRVAPVTRKRTP